MKKIFTGLVCLLFLNSLCYGRDSASIIRDIFTGGISSISSSNKGGISDQYFNELKATAEAAALGCKYCTNQTKREECEDILVRTIKKMANRTEETFVATTLNDIHENCEECKKRCVNLLKSSHEALKKCVCCCCDRLKDELGDKKCK